MPDDSRAASWYVQLQTLREDYGTAFNVLNEAGRRMYDLAPSVRRDGEALLNRKSELNLTPEQVRFIQERIEFVQRVLTSVNGKFEPPSEAPANDIRDVSAFLTEAQRLLEDCRSLQATAESACKASQRLWKYENPPPQVSESIDRVNKLLSVAEQWNPLPSSSWPADGYGSFAPLDEERAGPPGLSTPRRERFGRGASGSPPAA